jgi:hypothetical protein
MKMDQKEKLKSDDKIKGYHQNDSWHLKTSSRLLLIHWIFSAKEKFQRKRHLRRVPMRR